MNRQSKIKPGDIVLCKSFCECDVKVKLSRPDDDGWWGHLFDHKDIKCLQKYEIRISKSDETFVFDFQIIKIIRKSYLK